MIVSRQLLRIEVPLLLGVSLLSWAMALDGPVGRLDGTILFFMVFVYTILTIRRSRRETRDEASSATEASSDDINALFLVLSTIGHQIFPAFSNGLTWVVLPLTAPLLATTTGRAFSAAGRVSLRL